MADERPNWGWGANTPVLTFTEDEIRRAGRFLTVPDINRLVDTLKENRHDPSRTR